MPGRRNLARETAQHAQNAPAKFATLYDAMTTALPLHDRVLIGRHAILTYLHELHMRRPNGGPLTWRMLLRWRVSTGLPVLPGRRILKRAYSSSPVSTTHALTAWLLTRLASDEHRVFTIRVDSPQPTAIEGTRPSTSVGTNLDRQNAA